VTPGQFNSTVQQLIPTVDTSILNTVWKLYPSPNSNNSTSIASLNLTNFNDPSVLEFLENEVVSALYVPDNGTQYYTNQYERLRLAVTEGTITCNTVSLAFAKSNASYNYQFAMFPGLHGQDVYSTFHVPGSGTSTNVQNVTVANILQQYLINFAITGNPNGPSLPNFPQYGNATNVLQLNNTISVIPDGYATNRCAFWSEALFY